MPGPERPCAAAVLAAAAMAMVPDRPDVAAVCARLKERNTEMKYGIQALGSRGRSATASRSGREKIIIDDPGFTRIIFPLRENNQVFII